MKTLIAALILTSLSAQAETIRVHGIELDAQEIEYFVGSDKIHNFRPSTPVNFPFARGNLFPASDTVYLRESSRISAITSQAAQKIEWKLPASQTLILDCGPKKNNWGELIPRMVSFHENGEYNRGCSAAQPHVFHLAQGGSIEVLGEIDLNHNSSLAYASKINQGAIQLKSGEIKLLPGSEIAFHSAGQPHFFTLARGQSFRAQQGEYGEVEFVQNSNRPVSTSLFEDESVERGILGKEISFQELGIFIPAGSGVAFSQQAGKIGIAVAILSAKTKINAVSNPFFANRVGFNQDFEKYEAIVAETFTFKGPDDLLMDIPPGSVITLSENLEILAIRVPNQIAPFKRKQIEL